MDPALWGHFKNMNSESPKKEKKSVQGPMGHLAGFVSHPCFGGPHSPFLTGSFFPPSWVMTNWQDLICPFGGRGAGFKPKNRTEIWPLDTRHPIPNHDVTTDLPVSEVTFHQP